MLTEPKNIKFHAPPTKWNNPASDGYWIAGISPMEPFTQERFEVLTEEFNQRQENAREARKQLKETTWEVPSNKDPSKSYTVTHYISGSWDCNCQGFKFRHNCSHVESKKAEEKSNE